MKAVIQRVKEASVTVNGAIHGRIRAGLLIYLGLVDEDGQEDIDWLTGKITNMRIFSDDQHLMNRSLLEVDGEALVISQFRPKLCSK